MKSRETYGFCFGVCQQEEMTNALATMRVDYDQVINIKNLGQSNNALLKKRRQKPGTVREEGATPM